MQKCDRCGKKDISSTVVRVDKEQLRACQKCSVDWWEARDKAVESAFKKWVKDGRL